MTKKRARQVKKLANSVLALVLNVFKAVLVWFVTRTIEGVLRGNNPKISVIPVWWVMFAAFAPSLAFFLAFYLIVVSVSALFYLLVWGNNFPVKIDQE